MKYLALVLLLAVPAFPQILGNAKSIRGIAIDSTCSKSTMAHGDQMYYDNAIEKYACAAPTAVFAGAQANWPYAFSAQTSLHITTHPFTSNNLVVVVYGSDGAEIIPYSKSVHPTTYAIDISFNGVETSGLVIVNGTVTVGPVTIGGALSGATAGRLLYVGAGPTIAETSAWTLSGGVLTGGGNLLFSADNTHDIGASGATRPRAIYVGTIIRGDVASGNFDVNNQASAGSLRLYGTSSVVLRTGGADSAVTVTNAGLVALGGTTSAFPAIKRNGTALNFRLADDSADAPITAGAGTFSGTASAAPGGSVGAWAKYTVEDADTIFLAAGTSVTKTLVALPAKAVVEGIRIKTSEAFAGTGITACTVSLGDGTTATAYAAAFDVFAAVADTNQAWDGGAYSATNAAHNLVATFTCNTNVGDGGATVLTAGAVDIHVKWAVLP